MKRIFLPLVAGLVVLIAELAIYVNLPMPSYSAASDAAMAVVRPQAEKAFGAIRIAMRAVVQLRDNEPTGGFEAALAAESERPRKLGKAPEKLSLAVREEFLKKHGRTALSLLAVFNESGDESFLREAATRFLDDPAVQFAALNSTAFSGERASWLERFKKSDPDNAMTNWITARERLRANNPAAALNELIAAAGKDSYADYTDAVLRETETLYLDGAMDAAEARRAATYVTPLEHLTELRHVVAALGPQIEFARERGDSASVMSAAVSGFTLARTLSGESKKSATLAAQLEGVAIEEKLISTMEPEEAAQMVGQSAPERMVALQQRREQIEKQMLATL